MIYDTWSKQYFSPPERVVRKPNRATLDTHSGRIVIFGKEGEEGHIFCI